MSIPKIIHYCWFGGAPKPKLAEKCIKSWKKYCPDFRILEWNEGNFDLSAAPEYVRQAYGAKRWAFVTDYVRLKALTEMGGVYMDTDVEVVRPLEPFLEQEAFAGFEAPDRVQTGLLACVPGFPLFREFLAHYDHACFLRPDGTADVTTNVEVLTALCRSHGLIPDGTFQTVAGLAIYPKEVFCPVEFETMKLRRTGKTVTIHWFSGSWHTREELLALRREKQRQQREKRSQLRYGLGTALLGEQGYARLKGLLKRQ